ncbi:carboxypeptidase B-like [Zerene cesonia]|uniref:carboxypeptidase B-like n=1 Tax=Zerene cesonia TaxID=33412 RepID=UPI0018E5376C|nr:carboxypeptidase B-like [Zerene cesonia]
MLRCIVFCAFFAFALALYEKYDGHAVYRVAVATDRQAVFLHGLELRYNLDLWQRAAPGEESIVVVPREHRFLMEALFLLNGMKYRLEVRNVKPFLDLERVKLTKAAMLSRPLSGGRVSFDKILTYREVDQFLENLARSYPNTVTLETAGRSFERRPIKYVKISSSGFQDRQKPVIFVQSLLHAREWVTLPASLYAIQKLVIDVTEQDLVDKIDWIILPVANPDGYVASHRGERFWRKNRATGYSLFCRGVDLNRNFDFMWGNASSNFGCSEVFHGRRAFSEPEAQAIKTIFDQYKDRIQIYFDLHSFGSMILYGYGNGQLPNNALTLQVVGVNMATAIDAVKMSFNRNYVVGNSAHILYQASGTAADYAQSIGIPLSYTYELPGFRFGFQTALGFLVDPDFIEQAGYETWEGIKAGAELASNHFRNQKVDSYVPCSKNMVVEYNCTFPYRTQEDLYRTLGNMRKQQAACSANIIS